VGHTGNVGKKRVRWGGNRGFHVLKKKGSGPGKKKNEKFLGRVRDGGGYGGWFFCDKWKTCGGLG